MAPGSAEQVIALRVLQEAHPRPVARMHDDAVRREVGKAGLQDRERDLVDHGRAGHGDRRHIGRGRGDHAEQVGSGAAAIEELLILFKSEAIAQFGVDDTGKLWLVIEDLTRGRNPVRDNLRCHRDHIERHRALGLEGPFHDSVGSGRTLRLTRVFDRPG